MADAKLAPNLPGWMVDHANRYISSGGTEGHMSTGEERARLWEKSLEFWPPYADYQRKTEREIPVVVLDPVR